MVQIFPPTDKPWNRELKKLPLWYHRKLWLKNRLTFYLPILHYFKVIYFVYHCQNYYKTETEGLKFNKLLKSPFG